MTLHKGLKKRYKIAKDLLSLNEGWERDKKNDEWNLEFKKEEGGLFYMRIDNTVKMNAEDMLVIFNEVP